MLGNSPDRGYITVKELWNFPQLFFLQFRTFYVKSKLFYQLTIVDNMADL